MSSVFHFYTTDDFLPIQEAKNNGKKLTEAKSALDKQTRFQMDRLMSHLLDTNRVSFILSLKGGTHS
jgi:hypothetical protein